MIDDNIFRFYVVKRVIAGQKKKILKLFRNLSREW